MDATPTVAALRQALKAALRTPGLQNRSRLIEDAAADLAAAEVLATEETEELLYEAASFLETLLRIRQRRGAGVGSIKQLQGHIQAVKGGR